MFSFFVFVFVFVFLADKKKSLTEQRHLRETTEQQNNTDIQQRYTQTNKPAKKQANQPTNQPTKPHTHMHTHTECGRVDYIYMCLGSGMF